MNSGHNELRDARDAETVPSPEGRPASTTTSKTAIAGGLDIIAGVMSLIGSCVLLLLGVIGTGAISTAGVHDPEAARFAYLPIAMFGPLALLCLVIGLLAIIGGIAAIRQRRFWLALVGSIAALFAFFPVGIPAIVLTVMAEREFQ
jgi:hypothetical protein